MTETDKTKIRVLEVQMTDMKIQNEKDHNEIKDILAEIRTDLKCLDQKFAPKWVEKFVYGIVILVFSALIGGAISALYK